MSPAPEEIAGWRGRMLKKDGDTTVIYTNIEDEKANSDSVCFIRKASAGPTDQPDSYTAWTNNEGSSTKIPTIDIPWAVVKRTR